MNTFRFKSLKIDLKAFLCAETEKLIKKHFEGMESVCESLSIIRVFFFACCARCWQIHREARKTHKKKNWMKNVKVELKHASNPIHQPSFLCI